MTDAMTETDPKMVIEAEDPKWGIADTIDDREYEYQLKALIDRSTCELMVLNNSVDTNVRLRAYIKSRIVAATEKMIKPLQKLAENLAEPRSLTYEELNFIGELVTSLIIC